MRALTPAVPFRSPPGPTGHYSTVTPFQKATQSLMLAAASSGEHRGGRHPAETTKMISAASPVTQKSGRVLRYSLISISRTIPTSACDKCGLLAEASLSTGISQWST